MDYLAYGLFTWQHDCLMTFGANQQIFLQAHNDHMLTARWLVGLFGKIQLGALAKCLPSAWQTGLQPPAVMQSAMTGAQQHDM